jgi:hypothetical protein
MNALLLKRCMVFVWFFATLVPSPRADAATLEKQDLSHCHREGKKVTLCFDLRDDSRPTAGLVVSITTKDSLETRLLLPFKTLKSNTDAAILSTVGTAEGGTLVSFYSSSLGVSVVDLQPDFDTSPDSDNDRLSDSPLSFVVSGVERRFVYRGSTDRADISQEAKNIYNQLPDEIAVARPLHYDGLEVKPGTGKTEEPDPVDHNAFATFFSPNGADGKPSIIMLRYRVPATPFQTLLVSYGSKIVAGLAAPFIALLFLPRNENLKPPTRRIFLWAVGVIQVVLLIAFAYVAWKTPGESTTAAIGDWVVVVVAAVGVGVPLWMKKEKPAGDLVIKV